MLRQRLPLFHVCSKLNNGKNEFVNIAMRTFLITLRTLVYVPSFILFFGWIALGVRTFDPSIGIVLPAWTRVVGIIAMIAGSMLVLICVGVFVARGQGTPAVFDPPKEFVALGPYKYVRNPMYVGGFILLTGFGLYHHSVAILALAVLLAFLFHLFVLWVEEPGLEQRFGSSYRNYKNSVNRWLPKF
jgi:protein-S-isoprenylcysteine O-methyltransferase Ste14